MQRNVKNNIIKSERNKQKIALDGYFYNYKEKHNEGLTWRCNKRGCKSLLYTDESYTLLRITDHNHLVDLRKYEKIKFVSKLKENLQESTETAREIILKTKNERETQVISYNYDYLRDFVTKYRKKNNFTIPTDYDIPNELLFTNDGKIFLQYDSGIQDSERIIVFATNENILHLKYSKVWICDATFKTCPSSFEQLFTIQAKIRNKNCALLYCFMKRKTKVSYQKCFNFLKEFDYKLEPENIIVDFELGLSNAIKEVFPEAVISGCAFHFGQIIWRRIQTMGFSNIYKDSTEFKLAVKMLLSLSFVPINSIERESAKLVAFFNDSNQKEKLCCFFSWFRFNYLNFSSNNSNHDITFWNLYDRTINNIPRTTNSLEGFHRHLNSLISCKQQSIHQIGVILLKEQEINENHFVESLYAKNVSAQEKPDPIKRVATTYEDFYGLDYLKCIALNFNWKLD